MSESTSVISVDDPEFDERVQAFIDGHLDGKSLQLPLFEGERPTGTELKGSIKSERLTPPLRRGQTVFLLVEATVTDVNHKTGKGDIAIREHKVDVEDVFLMDPDEAGYRISELEAEHRAAVDDAMGRQMLPGMNDVDDGDDADEDAEASDDTEGDDGE